MKNIITPTKIFYVFLLFLCFACQKEDTGIAIRTEDDGPRHPSSSDISTSTYQYVTPDKIPDIMNAYSRHSGKISAKQFRESPNASLIMETTNTDGVKSYSMRLLQGDSNPNVLYNLVVRKAPGEAPSRPFIVKYETDIPINEITPGSYKEAQWSISTYWADDRQLQGKVSKGGKSGIFARSEDIEETTPPCGGSSGGGGGGGSGSGNSWWTTSNVSDWGDGGSSGSGGGSSGGGNRIKRLCNARINVSQYNCNGPNGDTPHPEGPNSGEPGDNRCGDPTTGYGGTGYDIVIEIECVEISVPAEILMEEEGTGNETHTLSFCEMAAVHDFLQSEASDLDTSQLALLSELERSIEDVDLNDCMDDKVSDQERKTFVMARNGDEEDGPATPEDSDVPDEEVIEDNCPDIDGIGLNSVSAEVLEVMNSLLYLEEDFDGISKEQANWILDPGNQSKIEDIHSFLYNNNNSVEAKAEALMQIDLERANDNGWDFTKSGTFQNRPALKYVATYSPDLGELMYLLESGQVLYQSSRERIINKKEEKSIAASELPVDGYNYMYSYETNKWYEYKLPKPDYTHTDLNFLIDAFWDGAKFVGRYALPLEDAIILIDGKDFDGVEQSQALSAGMIIVGFIPGGKIMKPVTKIVKGTAAWKIIGNVGRKSVSLSFNVVDGLVTFGSRSKLATVIKTTALEEAHHIIPWNKLGDEVVQEAAYAGFHMNSAVNGKALQKYTALTGEGIHGNHPAYDKFVQYKLDEFKSSNILTSDNASEFLNNSLIPELNNLIDEAIGSGMNLNTYFRDVVNPLNGIN
ncbi:AHH domain-containing protein [Sinomicrobium soli]|uniref:AHH domain-containing protein n=1 Tax=Sinomicrobium sp. N-1-3-6 TaxID=2219864 RepID=UPI0011BE1D1C|nr:AHH domain-containing protein [Sinomicrobium sp. N-1-3-6]